MFNFKQLEEPRLTLPQFRMVQDQFLNMDNETFAQTFGISKPSTVGLMRKGERTVSGILVTAMWLRLYGGDGSFPVWDVEHVTGNDHP